MTLEEYCSTFTEEQKLKLSIRLIKIALPVWNKFTENNKLTYRDSVVNIKHKINKNILQEVITEIENIFTDYDSIEKLRNNKKLQEYYLFFSDTVISIQDGNWELPYSAGKIFYSVYNLLSLFNGENETESGYYLTINQAIDAIDNEKILSEEEIKLILKTKGLN